MVKEIAPLGKQLVILDEQIQASMETRNIGKYLQESMARRSREEAQKAITIINATSREELMAMGITDRIKVLVEARRMSTKHNLFAECACKD